MEGFKFSTIEEAVADLRAGKDDYRRGRPGSGERGRSDLCSRTCYT